MDKISISRKSAKKTPFFLSLFRHDAHNLELKSGFKLQDDLTNGAINLYLFCPSNFPFERWPKEEIRHDFFSRLRLATPQKINLDTQRIQNQVLRELSDYKNGKSLQTLGGVLGEYLRREAKFQESFLKSLFEKQPDDLSSKEYHQLVERVFARCQSVKSTVQKIREALPKDPNSASKEQRLFARYFHHCNLNLLARCLEELKRIYTTANLNQKLQQLFFKQIELIEQGIREEYEFKSRFFPRSINFQFDGETCSSDALLVLSQLKKYFQANMYVDISRRQVVKRFTEPLAALAAASAGAIAVLVQQLSMKLLLVGSTGVAVAGCGVALYVLRDRLKDQGKTILKKKVSHFLPDEEQQLVANDRQIGQIKEWFSLTQKSKLPSKIQSLRHKSIITKAEKHLQENVIHLRRAISLSHKSASKDCNGNFDLQEVLRMNISRYLPYMDDEEKQIPMLDEAGNLTNILVRKEYHFHLCLDAKFYNKQQKRGKFRGLYKIVVDKSGIKEVVRVRAS